MTRTSVNAARTVSRSKRSKPCSTVIPLRATFLASLPSDGPDDTVSHSWNHLSNECLAKIHDDLLRAETGLGAVTAVFQYISS